MRSIILISLCLIVFPGYTQEIAITFDDAPTADGPIYSGKERTKKIIDLLHTHQVKQAAFFVITNNMKVNGSERIDAYVNAGHLIANHTHTHQWINKIGTKKYIKDIAIADSIIKSRKGFAPWFRYPFLDEGKSKPVRDSIRNALQKLNLTNGYVTIDNYDWYINELLRQAVQQGKQPDYEKLKQVYIEHIWTSIQFYDSIGKLVLNRSPKHVLLLHENDVSALFLGDLIKHIKEKGWKIISPVEAYKDPIALQVPDVLFNGQGRIGAIAKEKGVQGKDLVQESEDEAYLDSLMELQKVFR